MLYAALTQDVKPDLYFKVVGALMTDEKFKQVMQSQDANAIRPALQGLLGANVNVDALVTAWLALGPATISKLIDAFGDQQEMNSP